MTRFLAVALLISGLLVSGCEPTASVMEFDLTAGEDIGSRELAERGDSRVPAEDLREIGLDLQLPEAPDLEVVEGTGDGGAPTPGSAGYPCNSGSDCNEGYCIQTADGKQCTKSCIEECPFDWQCLLYTPSLPDQVYLCLPAFVDLCKPCKQNTDCWTNGVDAGQACVRYGPEGSFCGAQCPESGDCAEGFACETLEDVTGEMESQCVLSEGECECHQWYVDAGASTFCYVENDWGICEGERVCLSEGLSECSAGTPAPE